jgi:hypothetical protein
VLVLKKYLALPTLDKSTVSQVVHHFCEKGSVAKKKILIQVTQKKITGQNFITE